MGVSFMWVPGYVNPAVSRFEWIILQTVINQSDQFRYGIGSSGMRHLRRHSVFRRPLAICLGLVGVSRSHTADLKCLEVSCCSLWNGCLASATDCNVRSIAINVRILYCPVEWLELED